MIVRPRKIQRSLRRPCWLPLKKEHLREACATVRIDPPYTKVQRECLNGLNDVRRAPYVLALDTGRWYQRCPEQLCVALKGAHGDVQVELAKTLRRPTQWDPWYKRPDETYFRRKADLFEQHTKGFRYNLGRADHQEAFQELLRHVVAYAASADHRAPFTWLYTLDIGQVRELYRHPLGGLQWYDKDQRKIRLAANAYEVLEVVCEPGERPRRSFILGNPGDPKYQAEYEWWLKWQGIQTKRHSFRVRRIWIDENSEEQPAWYFDAISEFTIPLDRIKNLADRLPVWWRDVQKLAIKWMKNRKPRQSITRLGLSRDKADCAIKKAEEKQIPPKWCEAWQFPYKFDGVKKFVDPDIIKHLCEFAPQHGLFLLPFAKKCTNATEYEIRLLLLANGLLRWDASWSVDKETVDCDLYLTKLQDQAAIQKLLLTFTLLCTLKRVSKKSSKRVTSIEQWHVTSSVFDLIRPIRGPPA